MKNIAILGSTGSIGTQALDIVRMYPERFNVVGISAKRNAKLLLNQIIEFKPVMASIEDIDAYNSIKDKIEWVCNNFEHTQKNIESDNAWKERLEIE